MTDQEFNLMYEEAAASLERQRSDAVALQDAMADAGLEYLYYPSFLRRTLYAHRLLNSNNSFSRKAHHYWKLNPNDTPKIPGSSRLSERLNKAYFALATEKPNEPYILELLYLTHIMGYAPSTVNSKMSLIRKYHKKDNK